MNMKDKLIGAGAVLLAFGSLGTAAAMAQTSGAATSPPAAHAPAAAKAATPESVGTTDTDTLKQGDQTTPDTAGTVGAPETPDANGKADSTKETTAETPESSTASDGPGGHQDPPGQVDNQQEGQN